MFILSNWCHIYMYCDKENKHLLNGKRCIKEQFNFDFYYEKGGGWSRILIWIQMVY